MGVGLIPWYTYIFLLSLVLAHDKHSYMIFLRDKIDLDDFRSDNGLDTQTNLDCE